MKNTISKNTQPTEIVSPIVYHKNSKGNNMTNKKTKPIKDKIAVDYYKQLTIKKTKYTKEIEQKLMSLIINNAVFLRLVNSTLLSLYRLNPASNISAVDSLLNSLDNISNLNEMKITIRLIQSKLKNHFKPVNNVDIQPSTNKKLDKKSMMLQTLFDNKSLSNDKFFKIFYSLSQLNYTNDKKVLNRINNLDKDSTLDYVLKTHKFLDKDVFSKYIKSLYIWGGGKSKFSKYIDEDIKAVLTDKKISTFIDPFMGGLGSYVASYPNIKENSMKVILNDINTSIYTLNKTVQSKSQHKKVMKMMALIIKRMFIRFDTYNLSADQYKIYHKSLIKILNRIEQNGIEKNPILGTAILLFIIDNSFGGAYIMKDSGSYTSPTTDINRRSQIFSYCGKIEYYHFLYNSNKVKFTNKDYKEVLKKYSRKSDTFTTLDPPYFGQNYMNVDTFDNELKRLTNLIKVTPKTNVKEYKKLMTQKGKLFEGCSYSYGKCGDSFPHEELLKDLKIIKGAFHYFNYTHPLIKKYASNNGYTINYLDKKSTNGKNVKGKERKTIQEVFMTSSDRKTESLQDKKHKQPITTQEKIIPVNNASSELVPLTVGTAFSGIGAAEQALKQIGIKHINKYMIEIDKFARQTYLANHKVNNVYKDITTVDYKQLPYVDLFVFGSPCQSFSLQGKRKGMEDTRGTLIYNGLSIIKATKPKYFIYENVKGLLSHDCEKTFEIIMEAFKKLGYNLTHKVLNTKNFGLPQNRERLFIVGIHSNIQQKFVFPSPSSVNTCVSDFIKKGIDTSKLLFNTQSLEPKSNKKQTDIKTVAVLTNINYESDKRICSTNGISPTIRTSGQTKFFDEVNNIYRYLNTEELAAIQGFNSDFIFPVSKTQTKKQIGNSISVPVIQAILINLLANQISCESTQDIGAAA